MSINRRSWLIVGVFLWAVPTAIFLSLLLACIKPGTSFEAGPFEMSRFLKSLFITLPILIPAGILFGLFMNSLGGKDR